MRLAARATLVSGARLRQAEFGVERQESAKMFERGNAREQMLRDFQARDPPGLQRVAELRHAQVMRALAHWGTLRPAAGPGQAGA